MYETPSRRVATESQAGPSESEPSLSIATPVTFSPSRNDWMSFTFQNEVFTAEASGASPSRPVIKIAPKSCLACVSVVLLSLGEFSASAYPVRHHVQLRRFASAQDGAHVDRDLDQGGPLRRGRRSRVSGGLQDPHDGRRRLGDLPAVGRRAAHPPIELNVHPVVAALFLDQAHELVERVRLERDRRPLAVPFVGLVAVADPHRQLPFSR